MKDFMTLVEEMRSMQKKYFKSRSTFYLQESKRLEKLVDQAIECDRAMTPVQTFLFGDGVYVCGTLSKHTSDESGDCA